MNKRILLITLFVLFGILTFFPNKSAAEVTQTGTWGEVTWEFDSDTGELAFTGTGTLGGSGSSPWRQVTDPVTPQNITKIIFQQSVNAPVNSAYLFSGIENSQNHTSLPNMTEIEGLANLDTSNVTDMIGMFYNCRSLTSLNVTNFDTSNVTNMSIMFSNCSSLTSLDVTNFDTANVTKMSGMFINCSGLTSLNVTNFDTANVTAMDEMFVRCSSLTLLDMTSFDTSKVITMRFMFGDCSSLTLLDITSFDTSKVTDMSWMFNNCTSLPSLDVTNFNTANVTDMSIMFSSCSSLTALDVTNFDTSNVTDMIGMFYNCSRLNSLDVTNFDTSAVTLMANMFRECKTLTSLDVTNFDTSKVTIMNAMFDSCSRLTTLDVSNFNTSNVDDMNWVFGSCSSLLTLDLSNFDTSNVTTMYAMFYHCSSLTNLDISNFDTSKVTWKTYMFDGDSSLSSLKLGNKTFFDETSLPLINTTSGEYTGRWVLVSNESSSPQTNIYESSTTFMSDYDGTIPGTYVWETNKQTISASDYTMYIGDPTPTITDFKASAIDKAGNASEVTVDLSTADITKVGTYDVTITSADGQTITVRLTVKENKQTISASDYAMYVGDPTPTITNFKASATDKAGNVSEVTVDLSTADITKVGTYGVTITSADGQTITVRLTVKENKQTISASDYTMYVGDPTPTITDFKASAIDKAGNASEVTVDLSTADVTKAGTYSVTITSADGQKITVSLIVLSKDGGKTITTSSSNPVVTNQKNSNFPITGENNNWMMTLIGMIAVSTATIGTIAKSKRRS